MFVWKAGLRELHGGVMHPARCRIFPCIVSTREFFMRFEWAGGKLLEPVMDICRPHRRRHRLRHLRQHTRRRARRQGRRPLQRRKRRPLRRQKHRPRQQRQRQQRQRQRRQQLRRQQRLQPYPQGRQMFIVMQKRNEMADQIAIRMDGILVNVKKIVYGVIV